METHSLSSNSSYSHSEKLMDPESHRLSSNSTSSRHSSGFTEIFREGEYTHSFPSTPNSTRSSSCWNQEVCNSSDFSATESMLSERNDVCNQLQFSIGSNPSSGTHAAYTESRIKNLVSDLQSAHTEIQLNAAAELRLLAKHDDVNRILIARMGGSKPLIMLLYSRYQPLQLEATTALLNLSLNRALKEYLVKQGAIKALVEVLNHGLSKIVKENAAVALAHLAVCKANRSEIGAAGAIPPLIELLERGSLRGKKDAAAALYRMSSIDENKKRMIEAGALRLLVGFISSEEDKEGMVDKAMVILGNLVSIELGRAAFVKEGGITPLMQVIEVGAQKSKDLAIPVLFQMCTHSREHRSLMLQSEPLSTLISLSMTVDPRLKSQVLMIN
ncbi:hypothetical protein KP509_14G071000 [Ceratopteris richardii]|uniref:Uncharacterized protein n=1 Tax=Ceratopteris richardii TaxID=49495 RepID=A0A8T2T920_CERRI|nr:hypothetical protein KP509_14G071000 [Ceratopteris richardii]